MGGEFSITFSYSHVKLLLAELLSAFTLLDIDVVRRYLIAVVLIHPFVYGH